MDAHTLVTGLVFGESARWHAGRLWLADWGAGEVVAVDDAGHRETVTTSTTFPFSLDWLPDGRLLVVSRELAVVDADGTRSTYADLSHLAPSWNELVVDPRGNAFVNEAGFDLMGGAPPSTGSLAVVTPDGAVRRVADDLWFPNGMAVTADGSTLIVAESYRNRLTAYAIGPDGGVSDRRVWADLGDGVPDGLCLDAEGAVWYADVPNRRCVRVRQGGEVAQVVALDRGAFSCTLGGPDGRTLFIVATEWNGPERMFRGEPSGIVATMRVDVPRSGRP